MHKSGRTLDQFTLDSLREFLDAWLMEEKNPERGKTKEEPPKGGKAKKRENSNSGGGNPKKKGRFFCSHCKAKKRSPKVFSTHNSDKYTFLKKEKEGKSDRTLKRAYAPIKVQNKRLKN